MCLLVTVCVHYVSEQSSFHWNNESNSEAVKCRPSVAAEFSMGSAVAVTGAGQWAVVTPPAAWSNTAAS